MNQNSRLLNLERFAAKHVTLAELAALLRLVFALAAATCAPDAAAAFRRESLDMVRRELKLDDDVLRELFGAA